jgi:enoyl-[acyl-carrier protein] reductase II
MGTRFIASEEAHAAHMYKQAVVGAGDTDTTRTRCYSGKPMRCRTNDYINDWESRPGDIQPFPQQAIHSTQTGVIGGIGGIVDEAKLNQDTSCFAMGQSAGGVQEVKPVAAIVADIMRDAEAAIERMSGMRSKTTA